MESSTPIQSVTMDLFISDFDSDFNCNLDNWSGTPDELIEIAAEAGKDLLPTKSEKRYQKVYENFEQWKTSKGATSNSERLVDAYFTVIAK